MNGALCGKYVKAIPPAAILDDASATASVIDCGGASYAEVVVALGATDIAMTALKLQECDTSGGTYTDVTGADWDGGTDTDGGTLVLPSATDDNQLCVFQVDMVGKKRYLKLVATYDDGTAGGFVCAIARLSRLAKVPSVTTDLADGGVCRV